MHRHQEARFFHGYYVRKCYRPLYIFFARTALLMINRDARVQIVDMSNNPFACSRLEVLVPPLEWIRAPETNYRFARPVTIRNNVDLPHITVSHVE